MKFGTDEGRVIEQWSVDGREFAMRMDVEGSVGLQDQKTADKRKRRTDV